MEQFSFPFYKTTIAELPERIRQLMQTAQDATNEAYAPYSNFKVGAAALLANGQVKTGSNHENASYPAGICAERGLLASLNPLIKNDQITALAVTYMGDVNLSVPISPCGICRQVILEQQLAQHAPITLYMGCPDGNVVYVEDATNLLPFYFSSDNLK